MGAVAFSEFRQDLERHLDEAAQSHTPLVVTREGRESMVVISASEFEGMQETILLLQDPANAERLLRSVSSFEDGRASERELIEPMPPSRQRD